VFEKHIFWQKGLDDLKTELDQYRGEIEKVKAGMNLEVAKPAQRKWHEDDNLWKALFVTTLVIYIFTTWMNA